MSENLAFIPGQTAQSPGPLARYLPPLPEGVVASWLRENVPAGSWVLAPFGAAPGLPVEAARAGYRVVTAVHNPIARFLLEMAASSPQQEELQAALAELAATRKGDQRLEPHLRELYATPCANCGKEVDAEAFLWERKALSPYARIYHCPNCGEGGEGPVSPSDIEKVSRFSAGGLHRARALERVAPVGHPDRVHAEEALEAYLPRAVYAISTLINRLEGLQTTPRHRDLIAALMITAFDQANTLWGHPSGRSRPRQLTIPPQHRENNLWLAIENAVVQWANPGTPVDLTHWPDAPPESGGISTYEGRLKDLAQSLSSISIQAVISAPPRPNQAFWTLSALWAGWLWGREAAASFVSVLRRRRYDWGWHAAALHAALSSLAPQLAPDTPMFSLIPEAEPGFLSAAIVAGDQAGFELQGAALQVKTTQAQIHWRRREKHPPGKSKTPPDKIITQSVQDLLKARGEPASYLHVHTAALVSLAESGLLRDPSKSPAETVSEANTLLQQTLTYMGGFSRYGGSESSLEVGQWWLRNDAPDAQAPLADRVEMALVKHLLAQPDCAQTEIEKHLLAAFPGPLTPENDLIHACLESYAELKEENGGWHLRAQETPSSRRADLEYIQDVVKQIGKRLDYKCKEETESLLVWEEPDGTFAFAFYLTASAVLGKIIFEAQYPAARSFIVLPGGRANLVMFKLDQNPHLNRAVEAGWRFLKYRHIRRLADSDLLNRANFNEQAGLDPLTYTTTQIPLL